MSYYGMNIEDILSPAEMEEYNAYREACEYQGLDPDAKPVYFDTGEELPLDEAADDDLGGRDRDLIPMESFG